MGTGCETVERRTTPDGLIEVVGTWKGGRTGIFREARIWRYGRRRERRGARRAFDGYAPLVVEM